MSMALHPATRGLGIRFGMRFYVALAAVLIVLAADPLYPLLLKGPDEWILESAAVDSMRRMNWALIYLTMLGSLVLMRHWIIPAIQGQAFFCLAMAYFALSTLWSTDPRGALVGAVQATFTMAFGVVLGTRLGSAGIVRAFFLAGCIVSLLSVLVIVAFPPIYAFGYRYNVGALRGIFVEKNHLALFLSYSVTAALFVALHGGRSWWRWAVFVVITVLCIMAKSSTAVMLMALVFGLVGFIIIWRGRPGRGAVILFMIICSLAFLGLFLPVVLSILGEDLTFNGRTILWGHLLGFIGEKPILGWGYRGFWTTGGAELMRARLGWPAFGAHNVWMQALLWGGVIGLSLWVLQWWGVIRRGARDLSQSNDWMEIGAATLMIVALFWSLFETNQLQHYTHHAIIAGLFFAMRNPAYR